MSKEMQDKIQKLVRHLQKFVDQIWYGPLIGLLAMADNFILLVPTDGILISSTMLRPKRWVWFALWVALGSTAGAMGLAVLVEYHGIEIVLRLFPSIDQSSYWTSTKDFFDKYGLIVVFIVALTPLVQQPAVILAGLAKAPLAELLVALIIGRTIKFLIIAYIGSHAPRLLERMWGLQGELRDVGLKPDKDKQPPSSD